MQSESVAIERGDCDVEKGKQTRADMQQYWQNLIGWRDVYGVTALAPRCQKAALRSGSIVSCLLATNCLTMIVAALIMF
jgi:hypothetical protein